MRKIGFYVLLILGAILLLLYVITRQDYLLGIAALMPVSALVIYMLSPDRGTWYQTGELLVRLSSWIRKHLVLAALIMAAHYAIPLSIALFFMPWAPWRLALVVGVSMFTFVSSYVTLRYLRWRENRKKGMDVDLEN